MNSLKPGYLVVPLPFSDDGSAQTAAIEAQEANGYRVVSTYGTGGYAFAVMARGYGSQD